MDGNWTFGSEFALQTFDQRNIAFVRGTIVDQGVRYIDGPLADYIESGYGRGVLRSATGSPGIADSHVHTRSIVAADPVTHQVGMAVVSFPTSVAAVVPVGEVPKRINTLVMN